MRACPVNRRNLPHHPFRPDPDPVTRGVLRLVAGFLVALLVLVWALAPDTKPAPVFPASPCQAPNVMQLEPSQIRGDRPPAVQI